MTLPEKFLPIGPLEIVADGANPPAGHGKELGRLSGSWSPLHTPVVASLGYPGVGGLKQ